MKTTEEKTLAELLFKEHGSLMLPPPITAKVTKRSEVSLSRDRAQGVGIPYTKLGRGSGSDRVLYNIYDIVQYIVAKKTKVVS